MSRLGPMSLAPLLRRIVTALIAVVVGAFGSMTVLVATAAPADAWTDGACPTAAGVTVVIDFQDLGGGIWVRCAPGVVDSGFQALDQAGIPWTPTVRFSGFVCRINDKPSAGGTTMADGSTLRDPCVTTPPTEAYWSYWSATRGGSWCYSSWGGASRNPPEGTVEGWSFSYKRTASSSPPPRVTPPPAVPGSPTRLSSTDCDSPATAPTSPTNTAPPPTPSTTRAPSGGAGTGIGGGGSNGAANGAAGSSPRPAATGAGVAGAAGAGTPGTGSPNDPTVAAAPATVLPDTTIAAEVDPAGAGAVDTTTTIDTSGAASNAGGATPGTIIGADGEEIALNAGGSKSTSSTSSPVGVAVALGIITALTVASVVVRRRVALTT